MATDAADGARTESTLSATAEHYVVTGTSCCSELTMAGSVRIGDRLWARRDGAVVPTTVTALSTTTSKQPLSMCCHLDPKKISQGHALSQLWNRGGAVSGISTNLVILVSAGPALQVV